MSIRTRLENIAYNFFVPKHHCQCMYVLWIEVMRLDINIIERILHVYLHCDTYGPTTTGMCQNCMHTMNIKDNMSISKSNLWCYKNSIFAQCFHSYYQIYMYRTVDDVKFLYQTKVITAYISGLCPAKHTLEFTVQDLCRTSEHQSI